MSDYRYLLIDVFLINFGLVSNCFRTFLKNKVNLVYILLLLKGNKVKLRLWKYAQIMPCRRKRDVKNSFAVACR